MRLRYLIIPLFLTAAPAAADPWLEACAAYRERAAVRAPDAPAKTDIAALRDHLARGEAAGYAGTAVVASDDAGLLLSQGFGWSDREGTRRLDPDTVIDIGSVSKQFTSAAIMLLAERGQLAATDPIARHLPGVPQDKQAITIHHLLTHTSGINGDIEAVRESGLRDEAVAAAFSSALAGPPGEAYRYSNSGYVLLAAIVEQASGRSFAAVLQELFDRAGLHDTGWSGPALPGFFAADGENIAGVFATPDQETWIGDGPNWGRRGPGAMLSTPKDLLRWVSALRAGKVLSDRSVARMVFPHVREAGEHASFYGYGWAISSGPDGSCRIWHDGSNNRHFNILSIFPESGHVTHVSSLAAHSPIGRAVVSGFHPVLLGRAANLLPARSKLTGEDAVRLAGRWRAADGSTIELARRGDGIELRTTAPDAARLFTGFAPLAASDAERVARVRPLLSGLLRGIMTGHLDALLAVLRNDVNREEEIRYWEEQAAAWTSKHGQLQDSEVVATVRRGDQLVSYALLHFERHSIPLAIAFDERGDIFIGTNVTAGADTEIFPLRYIVSRDPEGRLLVDNPVFASPVLIEVSADGQELRLLCPRGEETLHRAEADVQEASV